MSKEVTIIALGECLIDMVKEGEEPAVLGDRFLALPGGAPANVAVGVSRLGVQAGFIGSVGTDRFGDKLVHILQAEGVDTTHFNKTPDANTTQAYIFPKADGSKDIFFYRHPGADQLLNQDAITPEYFSVAKIFHHGSISMIEDGPYKATQKAITLMKQRRGLVSFDPNYRPAIWPSEQLAHNRILEGISTADLIKISDEEMPFITGENNVERGSEKILNQSAASLVVVTMGGEGSYYITRTGFRGFIPGFRVSVVEVTGAGDAFCASLLVDLNNHIGRNQTIDLLRESDLIAMMINANANGALATTKMGAIPAMPTFAERMRQATLHPMSHKA